MIRAYNRTTEQYLQFIDYVAKFGNDDDYGQLRTATSLANNGGKVQITFSEAHNLYADQVIHITGTTNYDGEHTIESIDSTTIVTLDTTYTAEETSGSIYPDMGDTYFLAFLYKVDTIFTNVKKKTAYRGKYTKNERGETQIKDIAITEDEEALFLEFLEDAFYEIVKILKSRSRIILNPFKFNDTLDLDNDGTDESDSYLHFMIQVDEDDQIIDAYERLDRQIELAIENYIMKEWFNYIRLFDDSGYFHERFNSALSEVKSSLIQSRGHKRVRYRGIW